MLDMGVSQVTSFGVLSQKVVNEAKILEMIRCERFEECEGQRAHHSSHLIRVVLAPHKSRGCHSYCNIPIMFC